MYLFVMLLFVHLLYYYYYSYAYNYPLYSFLLPTEHNNYKKMIMNEFYVCVFVCVYMTTKKNKKTSSLDDLLSVISYIFLSFFFLSFILFSHMRCCGLLSLAHIREWCIWSRKISGKCSCWLYGNGLCQVCGELCRNDSRGEQCGVGSFCTKCQF